MTIIRLFFLCCTLLLGNSLGFAAETRITVPMNYGLIRNLLINQLYTGAGETARLWKDGKDCSFLDISNPQINGENSQVRIDNNVHARIGINLGGKCIPAIEWSGVLQTLQRPTLDATGSILSFPVTQATALDRSGQQLNIKQLQDLLNKAVQPKLADLKIDLNQSRNDITKVLLPFIDADDSERLHDTVSSLRFTKTEAGEKALLIDIGFAGLKQQNANKQQIAALSSEELHQWQTVWSTWSQNLENQLNRPPLENQSDADKATLRQVLQAAGTAFEHGLTGPIDQNSDPVRLFFQDSWDKLGPLLRNVSQQLPGAEGLRYLTLIAATDLMYQLESITAPLGLEVSANGLRKIVHAYLGHQNARESALK